MLIRVSEIKKPKAGTIQRKAIHSVRKVVSKIRRGAIVWMDAEDAVMAMRPTGYTAVQRSRGTTFYISGGVLQFASRSPRGEGRGGVSFPCGFGFRKRRLSLKQTFNSRRAGLNAQHPTFALTSRVRRVSNRRCAKVSYMPSRNWISRVARPVRRDVRRSRSI